MKEIKFEFYKTTKQLEAWNLLMDNKTKELFFGGGAGGGKSRLGCAWAILLCTEYQGIRGLIGRKKLKRLKETTLRTFFDVARDFGLVQGVDFIYNAQDGIITFTKTKSEIILMDLAHQPSDPDYDELGSLELTFAFVDEVPQITFKCWEVINSRIRYKLDEYGLIPKCLGTGNPSNNWAYSEFYKLHKEGKLPEDRAFVQALVHDNFFISEHYIKQLEKIKTVSTRERLLHGNWEYNDDPTLLMSYEDIMDLFTNIADESNVMYMSGDIARKGRDKMVLGIWRGLKLIKVIKIPYEIKKSTKKSADFIMKTARYYGVKFSNIVLDEDGIGGGVIDNIPNCKGFVNNSPAVLTAKQKLKKKKGEFFNNFGNLKTQCYFKLADLVEVGDIEIDEDAFESVDDKTALIEELSQIKQRDADKDGKVYTNKKEDIKSALGRSPDFSDMMMFRMLFIVKPKKKYNISSI